MAFKDTVRQSLTLVLIPLGIAVNELPFVTDTRVGDVARENEPLLAASGWTFAIWGLIFLSQLAYSIFQMQPAQKTLPVLRRIGWLTAANAALSGLWTLAFTQRAFTVAWVLMLGLLGTLIAVEAQLKDDARRGSRLWLIRLPYAVNLGWISVATLLNTMQWLAWQGVTVNAWWSSGVLALVAIAAGLVVVWRKNPAFGAVLAWGFFGIAHYRIDSAAGLSTVAMVGGAVLVFLVALELFGFQSGLVSRNVRESSPRFSTTR